MTSEPFQPEAPDLQSARRMLEQSLRRMAHGGRNVAALVIIFLGTGQMLVSFRYLSAATSGETGGILKALLFDLSGLVILLLIAWRALPKILFIIYRPLLEHGEIVRVVILDGPRPMHQRFTGQSTQPFVLRGALGILETLIGGWLPTRAVNFRPADGKGDIHAGCLYTDETLSEQGQTYALIDPRKPRKSWLIRQRMEEVQ